MPKALVLGGYGLIGAACMDALHKAGFEVTGVGRSATAAARFPQYAWKYLDVTELTPHQWRALLEDFKVVVNASGALQDSAKDNLQALHVDVLCHLAEAATETRTRIIQISAAGVSLSADTAFFRTKAEGDAILASSASDHVILRPTLVLGQEAYGGSALLRALAAMPTVMPRVFKHSPVQTVALEDVAAAVVRATREDIPSGTVADLTEAESQSFDSLALSMRAWLGLPCPKWRPQLPKATLTMTAKIADILGRFGWRAPLRSTSLKVLAGGIQGNPEPWQKLSGQTCAPLKTTLQSTPATAQDRIAARVYLAIPLAIATLSLFWLLSGIIGLLQLQQAAEVLTHTGTPQALAMCAVIGGGIADILLGIGILFRRHTRLAALGMIALSLSYLAGAAVLTPALFADPLGPMVKVLPGITLAALVALLMEDR
ncbi:SDR family oxidoreductase [Shimia sp. R9_1]|uniref:SDR family oxidoreductase n=1 Tax=Shimia sp. R9_1 TaxID=2821111 RepID=UPI001ADA63E8|nr:SDR family oxidoreductase [Shimia sp. R9_1]MBO9408682.1 SDR family oxidoreductase [Shimia sp. R9_1]